MKYSMALCLSIACLFMIFQPGCSSESNEGCKADSCSAHGSCDDSGGEPLCICDPGYAGVKCDSCAPGYQDNDSDGVCLPGCAGGPTDCSGHGVCDDSDGSITCQCHEGYAGDDCSGCANGYQDNNSDGSCLPGCGLAGLDCGEHGACDDSGGTAVCECHTGYAGATCDECATGYQDNDSDGLCTPDCSSGEIDCGANGSCDDSSGALACICEEGYASAMCDECAAGYQDNDSNGSCLPGCQLAGLDCGEHGECDDSGGQALCVCDPEYAGPLCDQCAAGYQDNDANGSCLPTCELLGWTCSGVGTCDDSEGSAICLCPQGYQPDGLGNCLSASGYTCDEPRQLDLFAGNVTGDTRGAGDNYNPSCTLDDGEELVYRFELAHPAHVKLRATGFDTVAYLRSVCDDYGSEVWCNDGFPDSVLERDLDPGEYFLFIDGYGDSMHGEFTLIISVELFCPAQQIFDPAGGQCLDDPCDPNPCSQVNRTVCEALLPGDHLCHCNPGYTPDPAQPDSCIPDSLPQGESCSDPIPLDPAGGSLSGSTALAADDAQASCGGRGPDRVYSHTVSRRTRADISMDGFDTVLHLRSSCNDPDTELACEDDVHWETGRYTRLAAVLEPGSFFLWADSWGPGGDYTLDYGFRSDPCGSDSCPGFMECLPSTDWEQSSCVCPPGMFAQANSCFDDPCDPSPCGQDGKNWCQPGSSGSYQCLCNLGSLDDGQGGCTEDPAHPDLDLLVVVEQSLYSGLSGRLQQYLSDLNHDQKTAEISVWTGGGAQDLRQLLTDRFSQRNLHGALLVGDLPAAWYEQEAFGGPEEFPCDLYLMDPDAAWEDADLDGKFDQHSQLELKLFASRLIGTQSQLRDYFSRLHDFRTNGSLVDVSVFVFIDDDWFWYDGTYGLEQSYAAFDLTYEKSESTRANYVGKLTGAGAEFVYQWIHSSPDSLMITGTGGGAGISTADIASYNFKGSFYNMFNCSGARFTEENLAMTYLTGTDYGLAIIGSTKTGGVLFSQEFHQPLGQGAEWGEAYRQWYNQVGKDNDEWHMGIVILGDPLLVLNQGTRARLSAAPGPSWSPAMLARLRQITVERARDQNPGTFDEYRATHPQFFE